MSQGGGGGSPLPSYYDEGSEYGEEYESEHDDVTGSEMLGADKDGQRPGSTFKRAKKKDKPKKDYDPRTDQLLEIPSDDYLMESLKNFKPPVEQSITDKSISALGDR